ncbi:MAG: CHRD domain-containing protein [Calditrichaeota bacterium]|nr:CHRD domain-containing protein [Calditrichota bacterium]MCB9365646.1 CHRD domain-containing protein [Calditrichota bacterium]
MSRKLMLMFVLIWGLAATALAGPYTHFAYLSGSQETPPVLVTNGSGLARLELVGDDLYYTVWFGNLTSNVTNAHIHLGAVGVPGGVVHPLQNLSNTGANGVWMDLTPAQLASLQAHDYYINVHTVNHGPGEIRGQVLTRDTKIANLTPQQEVQNPAVVSNGRGFGWFRLNAAQNNVEYKIAWAGLNAPGTVSGAHFHRAPAGTNGPVIVGLANLTNVSASGNWAITAADVPLYETEGVYVNVHSPLPNYPGGEIRGQIICVCVPEDANFDATADLGTSMCIALCPDRSSRIRVSNLPEGLYPVVTKRLGCTNPCDVECDPATYIQEFFGGQWQNTNGVFWLEIRGDGCICVTLDAVLPVELNGFDAMAGDGVVRLEWSTASESNLDRFEVQRDGSAITAVSASNSASGETYSWTDETVVNGTTYTYTLVAVNLDGTREELAVQSATPSATTTIVSEFALHQNYPNPFNPTTSIRLDLAEAADVTLKVFNVAGQEVASLVSGNLVAGAHTVNFDGANLTSGVYLYRLTAGEFTQTQKMMLLK